MSRQARNKKRKLHTDDVPDFLASVLPASTIANHFSCC